VLTRSLLFSFALGVAFSLPSEAQHPDTMTAQPSAAQASQGAALVQRAFTATGGSIPIADVTLVGTARRIAGSDDESGTATLKALATGETRVDFSFPSGTRSDVCWIDRKHRVGQWVGPDGVWQITPPHNLMVDPAWFFPALLLRSISSSQDFVASHAGSELRNEHSVEHLSAFRPFKLAPGDLARMFQRASQVEIYLDAATLLPAALTFNTHPDNDAGRDIPVEIRYSDYRNVNGVQVPFHVEKFLNNSLVLEFQFQTAVINSGIVPTIFRAQQDFKGGAR
jgi:hypothetical protein